MRKSDITRNQLCEIVYALPADTWITRLVPSHTAPLGACTLKPTYTKAQLLGSCGYLRLKNREGYHIYARPNCNRHILIDDLSKDAIDQLYDDDLRPAAVVMTSPYNHQAWITVSDIPLSDEVAKVVCRILAQRYGGDRGSADPYHVGRLPGFTNRKPMYEGKHGQYPFTRLIQTTGRKPRRAIEPASTALLNEAHAEIASRRSLPSSTLGACVPAVNVNMIEAVELFYYNVQEIYNDFGMEQFANDRSRLDNAVVQRLKYEGFDREECLAIILAGSDKARERGLRYAQATVDHVFTP